MIRNYTNLENFVATGRVKKIYLPAMAEIFLPVRKEFFVKLPARLANQNARKKYDFQKKIITGTAKFENHYRLRRLSTE